MTVNEIKNMDFETFFNAIPDMEAVHHMTADGTEVYSIYKHDVVYVNRDGIERTLQMIVPEVKDSSAVYPAILYVQGSAWAKQDQYKRLGVMARLAQQGFVTAILQYRESELAAFPAQVQDAKTGVRFLRKYAEEYHIDAENIFLMGDSSGGHTSVIASFTADEDILDTDVYGEFSCKVNAVVDLYGVTDACHREDFPTTPNHGEPDSPEGMLIGGKDIYEYPELSAPLTCANYVSAEKELPPILIMHGTNDQMVSYRQSVRLYKKLLEEEKDVTFYLIENASHGDNAFWMDNTLEIIVDFIKKHIN